MQRWRSVGGVARGSWNGGLVRRGAAKLTPNRTADPASYERDKEDHQPAVPTGMPQETKEKYEPESGEAEIPHRRDDYDHQHIPEPPIKTSPLSPPRRSSPTLESTGVENPAGSTFHPKRSSHHAAESVDGLSCEAGVEIPAMGATTAEEEDEMRQYYKSHKASPLAEIEVADTRKPITRATQGYFGGGADAVGWEPEQLCTAEQTLLRAAEMWRRRAERGDPDSPHGRVLRQLRGESF